MSTKKVSWPFYEGVLELANDEEREAILAGGPIQFLDEQKWHATKESQAVASRAFDAIRSVIRRIFENTGLRVTGIDARKIPPIREPIDPDLLLRGRISWFTSEDISCTLRVDWLDQETKIQFLQIEGSYEPEETPIIMSRSPRLAQNERIDDTERLELMQSYIDEGNPPKTAARLAILAKGRPRTQDDSEIKRLVTKFKKRLKE